MAHSLYLNSSSERIFYNVRSTGCLSTLYQRILIKIYRDMTIHK